LYIRGSSVSDDIVFKGKRHREWEDPPPGYAPPDTPRNVKPSLSVPAAPKKGFNLKFGIKEGKVDTARKYLRKYSKKLKDIGMEYWDPDDVPPPLQEEVEPFRFNANIGNSHKRQRDERRIVRPMKRRKFTASGTPRSSKPVKKKVCTEFIKF